MLPGWLVRNYGASDRYTLPQINAAVAALKLPRNFMALAYAAYLSADEYEANRGNLPHDMDYDIAREMFLASVPPRLTSPLGGATDSIGTTDSGGHGADGSHG